MWMKRIVAPKHCLRKKRNCVRTSKEWPSTGRTARDARKDCTVAGAPVSSRRRHSELSPRQTEGPGRFAPPQAPVPPRRIVLHVAVAQDAGAGYRYEISDYIKNQQVCRLGRHRPDSARPCRCRARNKARFEVTRHPTAEWLARQITEAFPWASAPTYVVRDNDRAYGHVFTSRVRAMGIRDRPISPRSPWQNPYVERLIGTVRRECLDRVLIFGEAHLRQILSSYAAYYNEVRTHLALGKDTPASRAVQWSGAIVAIPILSVLHHHYVRM